MTHVRLVTEPDAVAIAQLLRDNEEFLAPWEPLRDDAYFTAEGQRLVVLEALRQHSAGASLPCVILDGDRLVGRITANSIVRGAFQSASLGYWVNAADNGRGVATAAVGAMVRTCFDELGLHRLEAGTLLHNVGSQQALRRNGFVLYGLAPRYISIAGQWQDHALFQLLNETA
jgi:ribosomal-protein-alanine N-acetyltransferase